MSLSNVERKTCRSRLAGDGDFNDAIASMPVLQDRVRPVMAIQFQLSSIR